MHTHTRDHENEIRTLNEAKQYINQKQATFRQKSKFSLVYGDVGCQILWNCIYLPSCMSKVFVPLFSKFPVLWFMVLDIPKECKGIQQKLYNKFAARSKSNWTITLSTIKNHQDITFEKEQVQISCTQYRLWTWNGDGQEL